MEQPIQLVVGLGNSGAEYVSTRHNAGFWYLDALCDHLGGQFAFDKKLSCDVAKFLVGSQSVWLAKPKGYMNDSGRPVQALLRYYKVPVEALLVAHDELDLPCSVMRLKTGGGTAGHNGLKSIIQHLSKRTDFHRIRIGIGHPGHASKVHHHVLSRPSASDKQAIDAGIAGLLSHTEALLSGQIESVMKQLHTTDNNA